MTQLDLRPNEIISQPNQGMGSPLGLTCIRNVDLSSLDTARISLRI